MAISNYVHNPTPFDQEIQYGQGVVVKVPADGYATLSKGQMDDFDDTQAGYEETRQILETKGLFLKDPNREYDVQAVEAIRHCVRHKQERIREATTRLQENLVASNMDANPESDLFQERLRMMGILGLKKQVDLLEKRERAYLKSVGEDFDQLMTQKSTKLDPERTCFVLDPPKEFPSITALNIFLEENPEIQLQHEQFTKAQEDGGKDGGSKF